jgi:hypothetical protein
MKTTMQHATKPTLDERALYLGDDGRLFCGALSCAGMTAHFTARDLSGQPVELVTAETVAQFASVGLDTACETCGRRPAFIPPLSFAHRMRIECAMAVESWAIGNPEAARKDEVFAWLAAQDETALRAIHRGAGLGYETWERALGRK